MKKASRISWLDSLRGIAAFMVVILHIWLIWREKNPTVKVPDEISIFFNCITKGFIDFGKIGVAVFFIVSGYVIPYSIEKKSIKNFLISRFFRLYPIYWVAIIFAFFLYEKPILDSLINMTMFQSFFGIKDSIGVFWTLQIEWIFYILCILLKFFNILQNKRVLVIQFIALLIAAILFSYFRMTYMLKLPVALIIALLLMTIGMFCNRYDRGETGLRSTILYMIIGFIFVLLPTCRMAYTINMGNDETWYRYFNSYLISLIIFFLFRYFKFYNKSLGILGLVSYSVYLIHPLVIDFTLRTFHFPHFLLFFGIMTFLICIISYISFYLFENPFIKLSEKITRSKI